MVKVVVADIDNTLVVKHQDITPYTKEIIDKLKAAGIYFGIGTGRSVEQTKLLMNKWGIQADLIIGNNGVELWDAISDKYYKDFLMQPAWIKTTIQFMDSFGYNEPTVRRNGIRYLRKQTETTRASSSYAGETKRNNDRIVASDDEFWQEATPKLGYRINPDDYPKLMEGFEKLNQKDFHCYRTEFNTFEFTDVRANKGNRLEQFCKEHRIGFEECCAFGDMSNDISMFKVSYWAVCLSNGSQDAKQASRFITEKDVSEDGFADFCQKHFLTK